MCDEKQIKRGSSKSVKILTSVLVATALIGGASYYVYDYHQKEEQKKIQAELAAKEKYKKDLLGVADLMVQVSSDAEK